MMSLPLLPLMVSLDTSFQAFWTGGNVSIFGWERGGLVIYEVGSYVNLLICVELVASCCACGATLSFHVFNLVIVLKDQISR